MKHLFQIIILNLIYQNIFNDNFSFIFQNNMNGLIHHAWTQIIKIIKELLPRHVIMLGTMKTYLTSCK